MPLICRSAVTVKLLSAFSPGLQFRVIRDSDRLIFGFSYSIFPAAIRSNFARIDIRSFRRLRGFPSFDCIFLKSSYNQYSIICQKAQGKRNSK